MLMNVTIRLSEKHSECPGVLKGFFKHFGLDWRNAREGCIVKFQPGSTCHFNHLDFFPDTELLSHHEWRVGATVSEAVAVMFVNQHPVAATILPDIRGADGRIVAKARLSDSSIGELLNALPSEIRHLGILGFDALEDLMPLARRCDLITLSLAQCDGVQDIRPLEALGKLCSLDLSSLRRLREISTLGKSSLLRRLVLESCDELEDISALSDCAQLEFLNLASCRKIKNLKSLGSLSSLRHLDLFQCSKVEDFSPIASSLGLVKLKVGHSGFNHLELLNGLLELRELDLSRSGFWDSSPSDTDLGKLLGLKNIEILKVRSWDRLEDISALASLRSIERLYLGNCTSLRDLSPVAGLPNLTTLEIAGCRQLRDLTPLSYIPNLKDLSEYSGKGVVELTDCEVLEDLTPLSTFGWIINLDLSGCRLIADLAPLSSLENLESLKLEGCTGVLNLAPLSPLKKLAELDLQGAKRIRSLEPLRDATSLRDLECDFHPASTMEVLAHTAWCRRDTAIIEKSGWEWGKEAIACEKNSDPDLEKFMVALCRAFSLLGDHKLARPTETVLGRHPEFSSAPWIAWLGGTLQASGFDLYRRRIERFPVDSMLPGMIGGACATLPHEEQFTWSRQWLAELESPRLNDARALLGVAPEICLACVRLGESQALGRWLVRFTDPSDTAALDPVHSTLARYELAAGNLKAAENHVLAITLSTHRDPALKGLVTAFADYDLDRASIQVLLIQDPALRSELAKSLAVKPGACEKIFERIVVAAGSSPDALGELLATIPNSVRSAFVAALSRKAQPNPKTTLRKIAEMLHREADKFPF